MPKHMICPNAKCCFYKHEDTQVIYCDGIQEATVVHIAFASKTAALEYKKKYCRDKYKECRIFKMLEDKYNET